MNITELGYLVVGSTDLPAWQRFSVDILGAMADIEDDTLYIRLDELKYRILVLPHSEDTLLGSGWVAPDQHAYNDCLAQLKAADMIVQPGTPEGRRARRVGGYSTFEDPSGNTHEVCWGRTQLADPFVSPTGVSGFMTGEMGVGHVVLPGKLNYDASLRFYEEVFGFGTSDYFEVPTPDGSAARVTFLHSQNPRQHSIAIGEGPIPHGAAHLMLEVGSIDDVGRAMDRADQAGLMARTLGRHVNDGMVSFYVNSPAGFQIEYGFGGYQMDWTGHEVRQFPRGSHWGHRWL
ncbi:VOC family protein [Nocardia sp. CA2R105]|uniref:VOC family protein n=1 Tax=Nocardia coffeae TaxID=2873381 RepID=UPI001CA678F0|nr:VOC family protein [Nocardia coffeae]MBY8863451.1 VOC family protein [Nocardia coffeae]